MDALGVEPRHPPVLDPGFVPAALWIDAYRARAAVDAGSVPVIVAVARPDGTVFRRDLSVLPHEGTNVGINVTYLERTVKTLLWLKGGSRIIIGGHEPLAEEIAARYRPGGRREFDYDLLGRRVFREPMTVTTTALDKVPEERVTTVALGRHLEGCRIGFDLGGSDRKSAAVVDGEVVFSDEVAWRPYFESDPGYHFDGIMDSLRRAAVHMPRVDAIGGSAAGVWVDSEPRVGSLFRGVSEEDFDTEIRPLVSRLRRDWNGIPIEIVNDGEVTALAASMSLGRGGLLGLALGTSLAAGYCDPSGHITSQLDELAFVPLDLSADAPEDEWSKDAGCGVQYLSQQAVARLAPAAGLSFADDEPFADRLVRVQELMERGDGRARAIYETIGAYLGYAVACFVDWYEVGDLLVLGRVTSGAGGEVIVETAESLLREEFGELAADIRVTTPDERFKRHGQAIAAASLPEIGGITGRDGEVDA